MTQAQLLLQRVEWPEKLLNNEGGVERNRKGSALSQVLQGAARLLMRDRERSVGNAGSGVDSPGSMAKGGGSGSSDKGLGLEEQSSLNVGSSGSRTKFMFGSFRPKRSNAIPEDAPGELQGDA